MTDMAKRQTNLEVLRTISMLLVVVSHYIYHGIKNHPAHIYYDMSTLWGRLSENSDLMA